MRNPKQIQMTEIQISNIRICFGLDIRHSNLPFSHDSRIPKPGPPIPLSQRINLRMIVFIGVMVLLVGYPVYTLISEQVTGGVHRIEANSPSKVNLRPWTISCSMRTAEPSTTFPSNTAVLTGKNSRSSAKFTPNEASDQVHRFELVNSIAKCCFGGPPRSRRVFCVVPKTAPSKIPAALPTSKGTCT